MYILDFVSENTDESRVLQFRWYENDFTTQFYITVCETPYELLIGGESVTNIPDWLKPHLKHYKEEHVGG